MHRSLPRRLLLAGFLVLAACDVRGDDASTGDQAVVASPAETSLPFEVVDSSHYSRWGRSTELVATTQAGWEYFWNGHDMSEAPAKEIDFESRMLIGVMRRFKPYAGKTLRIEKVVETDDEIHVVALLSFPGLFCNELLDDVQLTEVIAIEKRETKPVRVTVERTEGRAPCTSMPGHDWQRRRPYDEYVIEPAAFLTDDSKELPARSIGEGTFR